MDGQSKNCGFQTIYCDFEPLLKIAVSNISMGKNCGNPKKLREIAEIAEKLRTAIPPLFYTKPENMPKKVSSTIEKGGWYDKCTSLKMEGGGI